MKNINKVLSRRAVLGLGARSLAGAGLLSYLEPLTLGAANPARSSGDHALVCIYLFGGEGGAYLAERSTTARGSFTPHPAAVELRALYRTGALTVLTNVMAPARMDQAAGPGEIMAQRYAGLRFLPNGFATPEWAARLVGIQGLQGAGAFTFRSGMSLVSPGAPSCQGDQFENVEIRQAMSRVPQLRTTFPDTTLGRQLEDVTRLLRVAAVLGLNSPVFLCTANGFSCEAARAGTLNNRYRDLSQAVASFHAATVELGIERQVTTYTDAEFSPAQSDRMSARLKLGGARVRDGYFPEQSYG